MYTDGILNAENQNGEVFGYDRMINALSAAGASGQSMDKNALYETMQKEVGAVQNAVFEFVGDTPLCVDVTMLTLGHTPE